MTNPHATPTKIEAPIIANTHGTIDDKVMMDKWASNPLTEWKTAALRAHHEFNKHAVAGTLPANPAAGGSYTRGDDGALVEVTESAHAAPGGKHALGANVPGTSPAIGTGG